MHFEILVEDSSGKRALETLVPKIIPRKNTFRIIAYKGIGRVPKDLKAAGEARKRILLDQLPRLLSGYGKTFSKYPSTQPAAVIVVCDLDDNCLKAFRKSLFDILNSCSPRPDAHFCVAIEEGEAWFLGDIPAVVKAYPKAKVPKLRSYRNDQICGTWEFLADAVFLGGSKALAAKGWQAVGIEKSMWAQKISPNMRPNENKSPSFRYFKDKLLSLASRK